MAAIGPVTLFGPLFGQSANPGVTNVSLNADDKKLAWIFQAPNTATILTKCAFRLHSITGTSPHYLVSLQGVDASGNADATIKHDDGTTDDVGVDIQPSTGATTVSEYTFDHHYHAAAGEMLALVVEYASGTCDGSNFCAFTSGFSSCYSGFPYAESYASSAWTKGGDAPGFVVGDGTAWYGGLAAQSATYLTVDGDPDKAGVYFTIPAGMGDTVSCVGFWMHEFATASKTIRVTLYDASDNVLAQLEYDSDVTLAPGTQVRLVRRLWDDATVALACGSAYRLVIESTDDSNVRLYYWGFAAAAHKDAIPWQQIPQLTYGTTSSWTDVATGYPCIGPIISAITEPTASGGLLRHPGMTGGING